MRQSQQKEMGSSCQSCVGAASASRRGWATLVLAVLSRCPPMGRDWRQQVYPSRAKLPSHLDPEDCRPRLLPSRYGYQGWMADGPWLKRVHAPRVSQCWFLWRTTSLWGQQRGAEAHPSMPTPLMVREGTKGSYVIFAPSSQTPVLPPLSSQKIEWRPRTCCETFDGA